MWYANRPNVVTLICDHNITPVVYYTDVFDVNWIELGVMAKSGNVYTKTHTFVNPGKYLIKTVDTSGTIFDKVEMIDVISDETDLMSSINSIKTILDEVDIKTDTIGTMNSKIDNLPASTVSRLMDEVL